MAGIPVALQLYSVRQDCQKGLREVLLAVADMGYDGVEFAGYHGHSAEDLRKMLDEAGLRVAGTHTSLDSLLGDELAKTMDFNRTIGNKFLIVPGLPENRRNSAGAWKATADLFNQISDRVRPEGFYVGYHNHTHEFHAMDGKIPWDVFFGATKADVVMQIDTGNALHGGADPVPFMLKYPGRGLTVHLKEYSKTNDKALIGEGDVRWKDVFKWCEGPGKTQWYIIEQESYAYAPLDCVRECRKNLKKLGR